MPHIILNSAADAIFGIDMEGLHVLQSVPARVVVPQTFDALGGTLVATRNSDRGMIFLVSFPYWEMSAKNQRRGPGAPPAYQ